ncbi:hypothetical protein GCM10008986_14710 [Salinibacillus aidingensis]|uniref:Glycosyltransferase 2-like domain-containing protein n=1 Tax=Salinibacillus aidingensis TaxID=237684 RepID=A0ABN1B435_9BACI
MKDITAILINDSNQMVLQKAVTSLKYIQTRLKSLIIPHNPDTSSKAKLEYGLNNKVEFISGKSDDLGQLLNHTIDRITTPYILILQGTDYLSPNIDNDALNLPESKQVLGTYYHNQSIIIQRPLLISTPFLKKNRLPPIKHLPFKEALLPAWLSKISPSIQLFKEGLVKQSRKNHSSIVLEKEKIIQKYQHTKSVSKAPSLSVMMTNYNSEKYVEAALVSCLLQSEPFDQILIMDDGSTDNSYQQLLRWENIENVRLFHKKNGGKARALNDLLSYVQSEYVLELDADDWLDPDAVTIIKNYLSEVSSEVAVLYGNLRKWKQLTEDVLFKGVAKGTPVSGRKDLLSYRFPLGPRIYRTTILKRAEGFPVIEFEDGRLYEDVSVLLRLLSISPIRYQNFTVYNVREHQKSITKQYEPKWNEFLKHL